MAADFKTRARSLYESLRNRTKERKDKNGRILRRGYDMPFTPEQFRAWLEQQFPADSPRQCRYCRRWITVFDCNLDHEVPLSRGGSPNLDNIVPICAPCNACKGKLIPGEFEMFRDFLMQMGLKFGHTPVNDITRRLESQVKLAQMVTRGAANKFGKKATPTAVVVQEDDSDF